MTSGATMTRTASLALLACLALGAVQMRAQMPRAATEDALGIIPRPRRIETRPGVFTLGARTVIWTDAASAATGRQLARYLEPATGFTLSVRTGGAAPAGAGVVELRRDPSLAKSLGAEGYRLTVRAGRVVARGSDDTGLFYAVQTMRQLLPPSIFRDAPVRSPGAALSSAAWTMPAVEIEDAPRFSWRGAHLDVGRHFMPKEFVKK